MDTETNIMGMDVKKGPTPEQKAEIERVVRLFDRDWMIDVKTKEIRRKQRSIFRVLRDFFYPIRHNVFALYWWLKHEFHDNNRTGLMAFTFPINHDNMPIPGYPTKYEIVNDWKIPKNDIKYLKKGPLARLKTAEILVPHSIGWERVRSWAKIWAAPLGVISSLLAIFYTLIRFYLLV